MMARNEAGKEGLVPESYLEPEAIDEGDEGDDALGGEMGAFTTIGRGRLLAEFVAEAEGELSVEAGGVVTLLQPAGGLPEGWLYARDRDGKEGLVPQSYVEMVGPADAAAAGGGDDADLGGLDAFDGGFDAYDDDGGFDDAYGGDLAGVGGSPGGGSGGPMMALADFTAEDEKEVSVKRGQVVRAAAAAVCRVAVPTRSTVLTLRVCMRPYWCGVCGVRAAAQGGQPGRRLGDGLAHARRRLRRSRAVGVPPGTARAHARRLFA